MKDFCGFVKDFCGFLKDFCVFKDFFDFDGFQRILRISWIFLDFFRIFSRSVRDFWSEMPHALLLVESIGASVHIHAL